MVGDDDMELWGMGFEFPPTTGGVDFAILEGPFGPSALVLVSGEFGVMVSRLPKSVSDRSM